MDATEPPISRDVLRQAQLRLRRTVPSGGIGQHLRRKAGQSLEFREFRSYQMGDDIRLVDWRASLRRGLNGGRMVRVFEAEERMTLLIIVDTRPAMRLPEHAPKLLAALWVLRALTEVAAASGDEVVLGTLFSPRDDRPISARGGAAPGLARQFAEDLWAAPALDLADVPAVSPAALVRRLRPASAVVLLSDLLFEDPGGAIAKLVRASQESWRQVFVQPLDSLGAELSMARDAGRIRVAATEGRLFDDAPTVVDAPWEAAIRDRVGAHVSGRLYDWAGPGLTVEPPLVWPDSGGLLALRALFATEFPTSGLLRGIAARGGAG
jgi:uncharacterized protein (DUF58 family)